jgi:hypothetical protein
MPGMQRQAPQDFCHGGGHLQRFRLLPQRLACRRWLVRKARKNHILELVIDIDDVPSVFNETPNGIVRVVQLELL